MKNSLKIVLDPFCFRQFEPAAGSMFINYDKEQFTERVNEFYLKVKDQGGLHDGYAPFCKHLFIENFTDAISGYVQITKDNEGFLKSGYEARRENELAVLNRWIDRAALEQATGQPVSKAKYLDIILYSKAQVQEENKATGHQDPNVEIDYDYGIVSVKPQDDDHETPMQPITMMRNALGKEQGGSGVALDQDKYRQSVKFWELMSKQIIREPSILKQIHRYTYCTGCLQPQPIYARNCDQCMETDKTTLLTVIVYWHNVPKINGYYESDDDCTACKLLQQPQDHGAYEIHMCERELLDVFRQPEIDEPRKLRQVIEEVDYFVQMSSDVIFVKCKGCCKVVSRAEYLQEHKCYH